jgi:hypothetical protein
MSTKQSCQGCGTHIEFDTDQLANEGFTVLCPKCQAPVNLLRPPPIAAPPPIITKKRHRFWILGICCVAVFAVLSLVLVVVLNLVPSYAITPERYFYQKPLSTPLDLYAFDLAVKELNKLFYKSGDFVFANVVRSPDDDWYVQGKRVVYTFRSGELSEADVMNGWEYRGGAEFFIAGSKRTYDPHKDTGWSAWTMYPGDTDVDNFLHGTTLSVVLEKKKDGDWRIVSEGNPNGGQFRPLSRDKVEELSKSPQKPSQ